MRVVVVGAGIVGASTAFHLAELGVDVAVVDRAHPGKATLAGAGIVCPWATSATDPEFVAFYVEGATATGEIVTELAELGETDTGYARVGAIVLARDADELDADEASVRERAVGRPDVGAVHRITGRDAQELFPPLRDDLPGLWIGGAARLDGRRLMSALLRAAHVEPQIGEVELTVRGDVVTGVHLGGQQIDADAVVVTGGAWTARLLDPCGVTVDVEPQKGQIVHLRVGSPDGPVDTSRWPTILPPGPHYLLAFDDSRVVVGATRETGSGFDTRVTAAGHHEVITAALEWAPGLADAEIIETRVGLRPFAPSGTPTIGPVDGIDRLFVGTGLGAGGLTMGPLAGRRLARHITRSSAT
jgi:D-amino-acid dehydrogenase